MSEHDLATDARVRLLGITDDDRKILRTCWPIIKKALPDILDAF